MDLDDVAILLTCLSRHCLADFISPFSVIKRDIDSQSSLPKVSFCILVIISMRESSSFLIDFFVPFFTLAHLKYLLLSKLITS